MSSEFSSDDLQRYVSPDPPPKVSRQFSSGDVVLNRNASDTPPQPPPKVPRFNFITSISARFQRMVMGPSPTPPPKIARNIRDTATTGDRGSKDSKDSADLIQVSSANPNLRGANNKTPIPVRSLQLSTDYKHTPLDGLEGLEKGTAQALNERFGKPSNGPNDSFVGNLKSQEYKMMRVWFVVFIIGVVALGLGLGLGLSNNGGNDDSSVSETQAPTTETQAPTVETDSPTTSSPTVAPTLAFPLENLFDFEFIPSDKDGFSEFGVATGEEFIVHDETSTSALATIKFIIGCNGATDIPLQCLSIIYESGFSKTVGDCSKCDAPLFFTVTSQRITDARLAVTDLNQVAAIQIDFDDSTTFTLGSGLAAGVITAVEFTDLVTTEKIFLSGLFGHEDNGIISSLGFIFVSGE